MSTKTCVTGNNCILHKALVHKTKTLVQWDKLILPWEISTWTLFPLPLNDLGQLDHYCHWFLDLSFSRMNESTICYTFTPCVGYYISPGIDTRQKGPPAFSVSSERHRQLRNCLSFEMVAGWIEPPSPRLTVWCSTAWPLLPTYKWWDKYIMHWEVSTRTNCYCPEKFLPRHLSTGTSWYCSEKFLPGHA